MKNIRIFYVKNCHFLVVKFSVYLNRRVFVMDFQFGWKGTLSGKTVLQNCFRFPSEKGSTQKLFPFRVDPFPEGFGVRKSKREVTNLITIVKWRGKIPSVSCPLRVVCFFLFFFLFVFFFFLLLHVFNSNNAEFEPSAASDLGLHYLPKSLWDKSLPWAKKCTTGWNL